ncbi:hypothetical protein EKN56_06690 [Limnobaculum zhutongyuii]|uniref:Uncharacterized protein n=1 Tax=Limnobaculum zhutongyuii TaxID=2498113 RepID=A0A411WIV8_9GAMM|nr:hypothetical protein [Limnobaculum zhutongyuii]QBH96110.1 hypothetical protein EKN56_06690 [Limnobaculum zhutongyuii]TQS87243.1 hypothetical protein ELQ32_14665 [Limnobaculum zhutongyuii]
MSILKIILIPDGFAMDCVIIVEIIETIIINTTAIKIRVLMSIFYSFGAGYEQAESKRGTTRINNFIMPAPY